MPAARVLLVRVRVRVRARARARFRVRARVRARVRVKPRTSCRDASCTMSRRAAGLLGCPAHRHRARAARVACGRGARGGLPCTDLLLWLRRAQPTLPPAAIGLVVVGQAGPARIDRSWLRLRGRLLRRLDLLGDEPHRPGGSSCSSRGARRRRGRRRGPRPGCGGLGGDGELHRTTAAADERAHLAGWRRLSLRGELILVAAHQAG